MRMNDISVILSPILVIRLRMRVHFAGPPSSDNDQWIRFLSSEHAEHVLLPEIDQPRQRLNNCSRSSSADHTPSWLSRFHRFRRVVTSYETGDCIDLPKLPLRILPCLMSRTLLNGKLRLRRKFKVTIIDNEPRWRLFRTYTSFLDMKPGTCLYTTARSVYSWTLYETSLDFTISTTLYTGRGCEPLAQELCYLRKIPYNLLSRSA